MVAGTESEGMVQEVARSDVRAEGGREKSEKVSFLCPV